MEKKKRKEKLGQMKRSMTKKKNHKYILNVVSAIKLSSLDAFCYLYIFL